MSFRPFPINVNNILTYVCCLKIQVSQVVPINSFHRYRIDNLAILEI